MVLTEHFTAHTYIVLNLYSFLVVTDLLTLSALNHRRIWTRTWELQRMLH